MLTPTSNPDASTCEGQPPLWRKSSTMFLAPLARLLPPVSKACRIAAGLPGTVLVGDSASTMKFAAKRALRSCLGFRPAASRSSVTS